MLQKLGRSQDALASFDRALALKPDYAEALYNRGNALLALKRPEDALASYDRALTLKPDYAEALYNRGNALLALKRPEDALASYDRALALKPHDAEATIPAETQYLSSDPTRVSKWQGKLGDKTLPRIGLVWSGSTLHKDDHNRSIPLADIVKLVSGQAQFVSLQKEVRTEDLLILDERKDIRHFGDELEDFADTAALIEQVDVVITVDTSVAHLAGALGKRVWILLQFDPDWRWLLDRDDSPWYRTARLFRQPAFGDWASVIRRVSRELESLGQRSGYL